MNPTFDFNHQLSGRAVEVHDEAFDWVLAAELESIQVASAEAFPQRALRWGASLPEFSFALVD